jgi:hypothetical protein
LPACLDATVARAASPRANACETLQAEMAAHLRTEGLPGAVWTLVRPDTGSLTGAAGIKDRRRAQAMTPDTRVHVGPECTTVLSSRAHANHLRLGRHRTDIRGNLTHQAFERAAVQQLEARDGVWNKRP